VKILFRELWHVISVCSSLRCLSSEADIKNYVRVKEIQTLKVNKMKNSDKVRQIVNFVKDKETNHKCVAKTSAMHLDNVLS
jgi:hypothetical protein